MSCIRRCGGLWCPNLVDYHRRYIHKSFKAIAAEGPRDAGPNRGSRYIVNMIQFGYP